MNEQLNLAEEARTLVQQAQRAVLSSLNPEGFPYASVVEVDACENGDVVMLLSRLAEHRTFLDADPRASILVAPHLHDEQALARPRVALIGRVAQLSRDDNAAEHYLSRHPNAEFYLSLGDFDFYRMRVESARYIAGFGRMDWIDQDGYRAADPDVLWALAGEAIEHMNQDHGDSVLMYARVLAGVEWAREATLTAIDQYGMTISVRGDEADDDVRVAFMPPLTDPAELRPRLVALSRDCRNE